MLSVLTPLEETKGYQSIFAEGKTEGILEGERKGKTEGKAEAKINTLKRQVARRFTRLPAWAEARIDQAKEPEIDAWLDAIFDADSVEDLLR